MEPMGPMPGPAWVDVLTTWEPSWGVDAVLAVLGALYLVGALRHGAWPVRRTASFVAALAAAVLTWNSGIAVFGHGRKNLVAVFGFVLGPAPLVFVAVPVANPHIKQARAGKGRLVYAVVVVLQQLFQHLVGAYQLLGIP